MLQVEEAEAAAAAPRGGAAAGEAAEDGARRAGHGQARDRDEEGHAAGPGRTGRQILHLNSAKV